MVQIIKRKIDSEIEHNLSLKRIDFNDEGVLTLIGGELIISREGTEAQEVIINLGKDETEKLKKFLRRIE